MAVQHKDSSVNKALMNICRAEDIRKETELIMKPYANWEEYLVPGPLSIAILGELACISVGQGDFSVNKNPPIGGFQHIKYPDSFLTCLMQVSNSGWEAFSIAHKNMDKIRILSMSVPEQMKTLVQTLSQEVKVADALLPGQLSGMKSIADECTTLAETVESKFNDVIHLIQELLEACLNSKTGYEKELEETKLTLESLKLKQKAAEGAKNAAEDYCNSIRKKVDETYQDYRRAMDGIPVGWNAVGMNFVESLTGTLNAVPRLFSNLLKFTLHKWSGGESGNKSDTTTQDDSIAVSNICCQSAQLVSLGKTLSHLIDEDGNINMSLVYNEKDQTVKTSWTKKNAEELLQKIKEEKECSVKGAALEICESIINVCQILAEEATTGNKNIDNETLKGKIKSLSQKVDLFDSRSKSLIGIPVFAPMTPRMTKCQEMKEGSEMMTNADFQINQHQEMLSITEEEYQQSLENFKKQNEELTETVTAMRTCETTDSSKTRDSVPGGSDAAGINFVASLLESLNAVLHMLSELVPSAFEHSGGESDSKSDATTQDDSIAVSNICCQSAQLVSLGKTLTDLIDEDGNINMSLLNNVKDYTVEISWTKENAEELLQKIKEEQEGRVKDVALEICEFIISICQMLAEVATSGKKDIGNETLKGKIKDLLQKVDLLDSRSKSLTGTPGFAPMIPNPAKCQETTEGPIMMTNAHFRIKQTQEMFKITEEEYQRSFENFKKQNEELTEILVAMRKCETKEVDFDSARKMLIKGLDALGRVKEQWAKMVCFFQMISSLIESCLSRRISEFLKSTEDVQKIANYSCNDFVIDMIYKQAFNASNVSHLVHMISETYTEVSSKYLMDKVSSLGRLISMDPSNPRFEIERTRLADGCDEARKAIEDLVFKKKIEFESNIHARVERISSELKAVLPEITEAEKKAIEDTVQKGMRELSPDESNQFF